MQTHHFDWGYVLVGYGNFINIIQACRSQHKGQTTPNPGFEPNAQPIIRSQSLAFKDSILSDVMPHFSKVFSIQSFGATIATSPKISIRIKVLIKDMKFH